MMERRSRGMSVNQNEAVEPFRTIPQAAKCLNIPVSTLRRAVQANLIPTHKPFGERVRVRLSEIEAAITAASDGGAK